MSQVEPEQISLSCWDEARAMVDAGRAIPGCSQDSISVPSPPNTNRRAPPTGQSPVPDTTNLGTTQAGMLPVPSNPLADQHQGRISESKSLTLVKQIDAVSCGFEKLIIDYKVQPALTCLRAAQLAWRDNHQFEAIGHIASAIELYFRVDRKMVEDIMPLFKACFGALFDSVVEAKTSDGREPATKQSPGQAARYSVKLGFVDMDDAPGPQDKDKCINLKDKPTEILKEIRSWFSTNIEHLEWFIKATLGFLITGALICKQWVFSKAKTFEFMKSFSSIANDIKAKNIIATEVSGLLDKILPAIYSMFGKEYLSDTVKENMTLITEMQDLREEAKAFALRLRSDFLGIHRQGLFGLIDSKYQKVLARYDKVVATNKNLLNYRSILEEIYTHLKGFRDALDNLSVSAAGKQKPVNLYIAGSAGIGKTEWVVKAIIDAMRRLTGERFDQYTRNIKDKFWSNYAGERVCVYDDLAQNVDSLDVAEWMAHTTANPTSVIMAAIQDKGKAMTSTITIATSNFPYPASSATKEPEAFLRRRDLLILVENPALIAFKADNKGVDPPEEFWDEHPNRYFLFNPIAKMGTKGFVPPKPGFSRSHHACICEIDLMDIARLTVNMELRNAETYRKRLETIKELIPHVPPQEPIVYDYDYSCVYKYMQKRKACKQPSGITIPEDSSTETSSSSSDEEGSKKTKKQGRSIMLGRAVERTLPLGILIKGEPGAGKTHYVEQACSSEDLFTSHYSEKEHPHGKIYFLDDISATEARMAFARDIVHRYHEGQLGCKALIMTANPTLTPFKGESGKMIERRCRTVTLKIKGDVFEKLGFGKPGFKRAKEAKYENVYAIVDDTHDSRPCDTIKALPGWILASISDPGHAQVNETYDATNAPMPNTHKYHLRMPITFGDLVAKQHGKIELMKLLLNSVLYKRDGALLKRHKISPQLIFEATKLLPQFSEYCGGHSHFMFVKGFNAQAKQMDFRYFDHLLVEFSDVTIGIITEDPESESARLWSYVVGDVDFSDYRYYDETIVHPDGDVEYIAPQYVPIYNRLRQQFSHLPVPTLAQLETEVWQDTALVHVAKTFATLSMLSVRVGFIGTMGFNLINDLMKKVPDVSSAPDPDPIQEERRKRTPAIEDGSSAAKTRIGPNHIEITKERRRRGGDNLLDGSASNKHRQPRNVTEVWKEMVQKMEEHHELGCVVYNDETASWCAGNRILRCERPGIGTWTLSLHDYAPREDDCWGFNPDGTLRRMNVANVFKLDGAIFNGLLGTFDDDFDAYMVSYIQYGLSPFPQKGRMDKVLRAHLTNPSAEYDTALKYLKSLETDTLGSPAEVTPSKKEACVDPMTLQTNATMFSNHVVFFLDGQDSVRGLMLKENLGVTVRHFYDEVATQMAAGKSPVVTAYTNRDHKHFNVEFLPQTTPPNIDLILFRLPESAHFRDVTGHLMTEDDVVNLSAQQATHLACVFVNTRVERDARTTQVERAAFVDFEYTQTNKRVPRSTKYVWQIHGLTTSGITTEGDCGSLCSILDPRMSSKVFGLHMEGNGKLSRAEILYREMILSMLDFPSKEMLRTRPWTDVQPEPTPTGLTKVGESPITVFAPKKTKKHLTGFSHPDYMSMEPTVLSKFDPRNELQEDFMHRTLALYGSSKSLGDTFQARLNCAMEEIGHYVADIAEEHHLKLRPLTKTEAINTPSYRELPGLNPIDRSGSAGYPFAQTGPPTKQDYLKFNKKKCLWYLKTSKHGELVNSAIDGVLKDASQGITPDVIFAAYLKDEVTAQNKIKGPKRKTRVFFSCPFDYLIAYRMYFGAALGMISELHHLLPVKVGTTTDFKDIHWQCLMHLRVSDQAFASDMESFDAKLPLEFTKSVTYFYNVLYARLGQETENDLTRTIRHSLHKCVEAGHIIVGKDIFRMHGSQLSGNPGTAVENSLIMWALYYLVYQDLARMHAPREQSFQSFMKNVRLSVYGDDNFCTVSDAVAPWFHFHSFKEYAAKYNFSVTDAAKSGEDVLPLQPLRGTEFLKRTFARNGKTWIAPLALKSIGKALMWINGRSSYEFRGEWRTSDDRTTIKASLEALFPELALHGLQTYREWTSLIRKQAVELGYSLEIPSWSAAGRVKGYYLVDSQFDYPIGKQMSGATRPAYYPQASANASKQDPRSRKTNPSPHPNPNLPSPNQACQDSEMRHRRQEKRDSRRHQMRRCNRPSKLNRRRSPTPRRLKRLTSCCTRTTSTRDNTCLTPRCFRASCLPSCQSTRREVLPTNTSPMSPRCSTLGLEKPMDARAFSQTRSTVDPFESASYLPTLAKRRSERCPWLLLLRIPM